MRLIDAGTDHRGLWRVRCIVAWARERFPSSTLLLLLLMYVTMLSYGRATASAGRIHFLPIDAGGLVATWCFFLVLRILDEHVDYASDELSDAGRTLQRCDLTLADLRLVALFAFAAQCAVSSWRDGGWDRVTLWWGIALFWAVLTAGGVFVRDWLARRPLTEMAIHTVVMPLSAVWMMQFGRGGGDLPAGAAWLAGAAFFAAVAHELVRKIRTRDDAQSGVATNIYLQVLGRPRLSAAIVGALTLVSVAMVLALREVPGVDDYVVRLALVSVLAPPVLAAFGLVRHPDGRGAKYVKPTVGIILVLQQVIVLIVLLVSRGLTF